MGYTADRRAGATALYHRWALLAGLLVGFGLRLYQLGAESFWYDETVSVYLARQPAAAMLAHTAGDIHPPAYYLLLHLWQQISRPALDYGLEFLFTWPSLWWGMLLLPLLYAMGRQFDSPRAGLIALWLAAFNPFQLWYSQEARMYTLGAALGLLCLWATLQFLNRRHPLRWLAVYVVSAAMGIYSLYYFALVLLALNLIALLRFWQTRQGVAGNRRARLGWLAAQGAVLLVWAPWLPIFWRQISDPPVPPWRTPWMDAADFTASLAETLAAPLVGQSPPGAITWPWALAGLLLLAAAFVLASRRDSRRPAPPPQGAHLKRGQTLSVVSIYIFVPIALLYLITAWLTPVYHVRYLFIYTAPFVLLAAAVIEGVAARWGKAAFVVFAGIFVASFFSLRAMWTSPLYRADDHRGAVAALAHDWRPGDAILANAGWIYTILATYWPAENRSAGEAVPPDIVHMPRINDYANNDPVGLNATPVVLRTGSVDGDASLGWSNPNADFFAVSHDDTYAALALLAANHRRIWHYRLYDTVNDPAGVIRSWLERSTTPLLERPIPGRDFGLVQLFATGANLPATPGDADDVAFGSTLHLLDHTLPATITAGSQLYVDLRWSALPDLAAMPVDLSMSLRLYDGAGVMAAQADEPPRPATSTWTPGAAVTHPAALPIPADTPPGPYSVELVVYRQDDGTPLFLPEDARTVDGQRWKLGTVTVLPVGDESHSDTELVQRRASAYTDK